MTSTGSKPRPFAWINLVKLFLTECYRCKKACFGISNTIVNVTITTKISCVGFWLYVPLRSGEEIRWRFVKKMILILKCLNSVQKNAFMCFICHRRWMYLSTSRHLFLLSQFHVRQTLFYLDSWIKIDQLVVTCSIISLFTVQHVSKVSTSIFRSLRLIADLLHVLYCSGSMCVGVTVWFGWGGVVSLCSSASACIRIPHHPSYTTPHRNTITHRTRAIQPMK